MGHEFMASLSGPGLHIRNGTRIGRNHLQDLSDRQFINGLLGLNNGKGAKQSLAVQQLIYMNRFHIFSIMLVPVLVGKIKQVPNIYNNLAIAA